MTPHMKVKSAKHGNAPESGGTPAAAEAISTQSWASYFSGSEWFAFGLFMVLGVILRWTMLDMRPYHHDESLHGMYGRYFYDWPNSNFYRYDPMLHGPMLYNCMRFVYAMFGDSLWAARTPVAFMGTMFMFVPFLFRNHIKRSTVLILTAAVALSPTLIYWARFLREDTWVVAGMLFCFYGFTIAPRPLKALFVLFGLTVQWCTKENVFVTVAIFMGYPIFEASFNELMESTPDSIRSFFMRLCRFGGTVAVAMLVKFFFPVAVFTDEKTQGLMFNIQVALVIGLVFAWFIFECVYESKVAKKEGNLFAAIGSYITNNFGQTLGAVAVCALVFSWFYGAGFRSLNNGEWTWFKDGVVGGLGGKAIDYWYAHHKMERIKGPFNFHVYVNAWYEFPFFIAFLTQMGLFYRRATRWIQYTAATIVAMIVFACVATPAEQLQDMGAWKAFKLKDHLDIIGLFVLTSHALLVTIQHLLRRERALATAGYFFTATFFSYSYLGEKVPWLSVYPLVFGFPYLALFFEDYFRKYPFNYKQFPVSDSLLWIGSISMALGLIFIAEQGGSLNDRLELENVVFISFGLICFMAAMVHMAYPYLGRIHVARWVVAIGCIYLFRAAIQTNYVYAGKETEYLSQVHTTYELAETAKQIIDEVKFERKAYRPKVYATGESTWPLTWYFRNIPDEYRFNAKPDEMPNFTYIYQGWKEGMTRTDFPEGYYPRRINLRGWWVPEWREVTLKKFLRYGVNHYPWSSSGFSYAYFLTAKDTTKFKEETPLFRDK